MHLRYDPVGGHLKRDPATGHLVYACAGTPLAFDIYGSAAAGGEDIYSGGVEATYADAVADFPDGPVAQVTWGGGVSGWGGSYSEEDPAPDPKYIAAVNVEAGGTTFNCDTSALSATPSAATLRFSWEQSDINWPAGFDVQVRIKSSAFSEDLTVATGEGELVGTLSVTDGGSDDEAMSLGADARGEISTTGDTYIGFFSDPSAEPASFAIPGPPTSSGSTCKTIVTITDVTLFVA